MKLAEPGAVRTVVSGIDTIFRPFFAGDHLYLNTNWKAPNWRLMRLPLADPSLDRAVEIIPERKTVLNDVSFAGGKIFASYLEDVKTRIEIFDPDGKLLGVMPTPGLGSTWAPFGRWDSTEAFYAYSSFTEPSTVYRYDTQSGRSQLWQRTPIPVRSEQFETKQVWFRSKDGTRVPMFLVHRKGFKPTGASPVYLTGYGGFNIPETPGFSATASVWADLGGVYALANLRGGGEFGEEWHKAGMLEKKQNVFDDFFAAAGWLIANNYARPSGLAIAGTSNGGLLVGAALTQRPDLFGAVLCRMPLLDMVRYHKFLLGRFWIPEYGSSDDPKQFEYLLKYSPYHKVEKGAKYPAIMFSSGDSDTRVDPLHARKMTALVQSASGSGRPVILKYDTKAGHSGGKPVSQQAADAADELLFLWTQTGGVLP
jgi:prolyl oligopeptidase